MRALHIVSIMFGLKLTNTTRRTLAACAVGSAGLGFASSQFLPNTYFLNKFEEVVRMYRYGTHVSIPSKVQHRLEDVMNEMKLSSTEKNLIRPFTVYGFDMFHAGSTRTSNGAIIGIPSNFFYSSVDDVETQIITVLNRSVDWQSEAGKLLQESLVLTEAAQKYLIAYNISILNSPYVYQKSSYPLIVSLFIYTIAYSLNNKLKLLQRAPIFRIVMYTLVGLFGLGMWSLLQDVTTTSYEMEADEAACSLGREYIEGGIEAYTKIMQRNTALRELMGSKGNWEYTATGNEVYYVRQKHLPLSHHKRYVELQFKKLVDDDSIKSDNVQKTDTS